jgi:hypothetical protein
MILFITGHHKFFFGLATSPKIYEADTFSPWGIKIINGNNSCTVGSLP